MTIAPGSRIGVYEVLAFAGQGGMGAVYRARDTALGRVAALKVLPADVAADPGRVKRFQREAMALAALNHPNIAQVFSMEHEPGSGEAPAIRAIAMEFVDGHDLAVRIGSLTVLDALTLAAQIASALEAAHDANIIHRDLKPANVRVTPAGLVKVLDFGIAKDVAVDSTGNATADLMTEVGASIGTPGYMSPEQLRGHAVDKRTDIWAFGCLLFEMLSGQRAFSGVSRSESAAATLEREPQWAALPVGTPKMVVTLLERCLEKDRARRFRDIGDARMLIEDVVTERSLARPAPSPPAARRPVMLFVGGAVIAAASAMWAIPRLAAPPAPTGGPAAVRFDIVTPAAHALNVATTTPTIAISSDGRTIAYIDSSLQTSGGAITVRGIDDLVPRAVSGVKRAREPFFSPDGRWIAYMGERGLSKVAVAGGEPQVIVANTDVVRGGAWLGDGTIVYSTTEPTTGLLRVNHQGGTPSVLTVPDPGANETDHLFPASLPGGRGILFTSVRSDGSNAVAVLDLESRAIKTLVAGAACGRYAASGHLLYAAGGTLYAVRFDLATLDISGDPAALVDRMLMGTAGCAYFATSETGTLAYVPAEAGDRAPHTLAWVDRRGAELPVPAPARGYLQAHVSPDGSKIAVAIDADDRDVWVWDVEREALTRVTSHPAPDRNPLWMPDGRRLVFSSTRAGVSNLYEQAADGSGSARRLTTSPQSQFPTSVTPDGAIVLGYQGLRGPWSLFRLPLGPPDAVAEPLLDQPGSLYFPAVSPNGRFIAYGSNEAGSGEVFVRPFHNPGSARWQVSRDGGELPRWSRDGRELFFLDPARRLVSAVVDSSGPAFHAGPPAVVLPRPYASYDVTGDSHRFLVIKPADTPSPGSRLVVWLNPLRDTR